MNKIIKFSVLLLITFLSLNSCLKNDVESIPSSFDKKVLIEEFSGEWCSSCVFGAKQFIAVLDENPENFFGVSIHQDDPLEVQFPKIASLLLAEFKILYFPYAIIDRTTDTSIGWIAESNNRLTKNFNVGLKLKTSIDNNLLNIKVEYVGNEDYDNVYLTVYLVEDFVPESSPGAQSGGNGNYIHRHVLREVLTNKLGDPIGKINNIVASKEYNDINIGGYKRTDLKVIGFLHFDSSKKFEVLNTNGVEAGRDINW